MAGKKGFTLIEMLVVVLVIGILAAIALPQYKKSIHRTKLNKLVSLARTVKNAQEAYYLVHGEYARQFRQLDVDLSGICPLVREIDKGLIICDSGIINMFNGRAGKQLYMDTFLPGR